MCNLQEKIKKESSITKFDLIKKILRKVNRLYVERARF